MKNLFKALAKFQQTVPAIHEATKGYGYTYADLKTIFKVINPILKENNLGFTQLLDGFVIKTIVFHTESGECIESFAEIPQGVVLKGMNTFQTQGAGITYYRRYAISCALGLVTDLDNDAAGEKAKPKLTKDYLRTLFEEKADNIPPDEIESVQAAVNSSDSSKYQRVYNYLSKL